ncbi:hypothetical protein BD414DRAFT_487314 [Trametes punicea]|nr:hypothetical protein BD414DRAFT_487314 [Trametes punicea]
MREEKLVVYVCTAVCTVASAARVRGPLSCSQRSTQKTRGATRLNGVQHNTETMPLLDEGQPSDALRRLQLQRLMWKP